MTERLERTFAAVAATLLLSIFAAVAADAPAPAGPRIEFESLEHDFGHATSGAPLTTEFKFKNVGDEVLVIESVKGG